MNHLLAAAAAIEISALQKGQSGCCSLVSTHFMTQWSWKMCLQGVSRIIVAGRKSSTHIAQDSWFSLYLVAENFFLGRALPIKVSFYLFCCSIMRWAAIGSCTLSTIKLASSIALFAFARYLQKTQKLAQQQNPPKPSVTSTASMNISMLVSSSSMHKKASFFYSSELSTVYPHSVTFMSNGFRVN